jgi:hypothetical protein
VVLTTRFYLAPLLRMSRAMPFGPYVPHGTDMDSLALVLALCLITCAPQITVLRLAVHNEKDMELSGSGLLSFGKTEGNHEKPKDSRCSSRL